MHSFFNMLCWGRPWWPIAKRKKEEREIRSSLSTERKQQGIRKSTDAIGRTQQIIRNRSYATGHTQQIIRNRVLNTQVQKSDAFHDHKEKQLSLSYLFLCTKIQHSRCR